VGKKWKDILAEMPRLTKEQVKAVSKIVEYHMDGLVYDYPRVDEATWLVYRDIDRLAPTEPTNTTEAQP